MQAGLPRQPLKGQGYLEGKFKGQLDAPIGWRAKFYRLFSRVSCMVMSPESMNVYCVIK